MFNDLFWALYWIDILSNIGRHLFLTVFLGGIAGAAVCLVRDFPLPRPRPSSFLLGSLPALIIGLVSTFVPDKQTMYMMLGVKTTENVVESPLGKKLQQIIDAEVDGYLKKLQPKSKE
jgi:hypothetical protein